MPPSLAPNPTAILHAVLLKSSPSHLPPHLSFNSLLAAAAAAPQAHIHSLVLPAFALAHRSPATAAALDSYALCSVLRSASAAATEPLHSLAAKSGWLGSVFVSCTVAASYGRSGRFLDARKLFDESPIRNGVFGNAVLAGYVNAGEWLLSLEFVRKFQEFGLQVDGYTMSAVVRACGALANVGLGRHVHGYALRRVRGAESDVFLMVVLLDMYAKCGLIGCAERVFRLAQRANVGRRDVVLWTAMLNAYGRHGRSREVIQNYEEMLMFGVWPDELTMLAVLSACQHAGEVVKGLKYFKSMHNDFGLVPTSEHYGCVVNMLCRSGDVAKAWEIATNGDSGVEFGVSVWGVLLSACRDCGNVEVGSMAAQKALKLEPGNVGIYVELSNLYARAGLWEEIGQLREVMKKKSLEKDLGSTWVKHGT